LTSDTLEDLNKIPSRFLAPLRIVIIVSLGLKKNNTGTQHGSDVKVKKKIIIVEDSDFYRAALKDLINSQDHLEVVAEAADGIEAAEMLERFKADLVLLDLRLPKTSGYDILREIGGNPAIKIMVLSLLESEQSIQTAMEAGADGYCFKDVSREEILKAISMVLSGKRYVSRAKRDYPDERRADPRKGCDCSIQWAYFNTTNFMVGRMVNCGRNGCFFETDQPVRTGSTVIIRLESQSSVAQSKPPDCLRSSAMAEVKWCHQQGKVYVVGARYHYPV
jgi:CheY-like chemotaxis protein